MQVHGARVGVQLACAEVLLLVSLCDADNHVVSGVGGRGANAEDLSGDDDVGLEAEVVVGNSQRRVLTLQVVWTANPLAAPTRDTRKAKQYLYSTFQQQGNSKLFAKDINGVYCLIGRGAER